jgi:hypothetical protein
MTLTAEQSRTLVDAIAAAPSVGALEQLRREAGREFGLDVLGSFVELLIDLRRAQLERPHEPTRRGRIA